MPLATSQRSLLSTVGALESPPWHAGAACHTLPPELFFPAGRTGTAQELAESAKRVCARCAVAEACLRFAMETNQEYGVWGGTTEDERRALRQPPPGPARPQAGGVAWGAAR